MGYIARYEKAKGKINDWVSWWPAVVYPGIFFGGVQQIQLRTEDRESGDLGAVAS
jgi:hypothetical protein